MEGISGSPPGPLTLSTQFSKLQTELKPYIKHSKGALQRTGARRPRSWLVRAPAEETGLKGGQTLSSFHFRTLLKGRTERARVPCA